MEPQSLRVVIIDDHPLLRAGMRSELERSPYIEVVAEGWAGDHLESLVQKHRPDIVLLDLVMPQHDGESLRDGAACFEAEKGIKRSLAHYPKTHIVVVSQELRQGVIEQLANAGASGYLLKDDSLTLGLINTLRHVCDGGVCFSPGVTRHIMEQRHIRFEDYLLSDREREVLREAILQVDKDGAEVAESLGVSLHTYRWHLARIRQILGVRTQSAAVLKGMQLGVVRPEELRL